MLHEQLVKRLKRSQSLLCDLLDALNNDYLAKKLPNLPSNTIGQQYWCIIGARTSYIKAARAKKWEGFECCLDYKQAHSQNEVLTTLKSTYKEIENYLATHQSIDEKSIDFLLDLLEHEIQHHGQLIRYIYASKIAMPTIWKDRYSLD